MRLNFKKNNFKIDEDLDIGLNENMQDELNLEDNDFDNIDTSFSDDTSISPMEKHKDLLLKLTDFQPYLQSQIMEWLGMYWDSDKEKYVRDEKVEPMLNIQGARWGINFLRTYTRDNNIITNFERNDYKGIMKSVIRIALFVPAVRREDFGLKNNSDILTFSNQLIDSVKLVLLGAGGKNNYGDLLQKTIARHESVNLSDNKLQNNNVASNKKSIMNNMSRWLKGE